VPADELKQPNIVFLLAWLDAEAVGCGALVDHAGEYGELKRIYVRPACRRAGVGRAILGELFSQARSRGLRVLRLETGNAQPEALAMYERAGFRRRGPFGDYREDPLSLFMELELG
jgi:putative acetyltransferase